MKIDKTLFMMVICIENNFHLSLLTLLTLTQEKRIPHWLKYTSRCQLVCSKAKTTSTTHIYVYSNHVKNTFL